MAENESATAVAEQVNPFSISLEDAGPGTKKVTIEIPEVRIQDTLEQQFKELRKEAAIPGFRPGHAPRKLIERKFSDDVREQVRSQLIRDSYQEAVEKNSLNVLGEPEFENTEAIKLPESGPLKYTFSVEVQPDITLPDLKGLKIKKPKVDVTDENVQQAYNNLRDQQGALVPVEDRGVIAKDFLSADVQIKADGAEIVHQHDAQLVARPGRVAGVQVDELDQKLDGMKPGEKREINVHVPEGHADEKLRGKDVVIEISLKDIKKLEPREVNQEFLDELGFANDQELRDALREQLVERIGADVQQAQREQVHAHLLQNVNVELPTKLSAKQTERVVNRRAVSLMTRGMSQDQVVSNLEKLKEGAVEEGARELKLFFILQKLAQDQGVDVDEAELNGRIAMMAAQRGERPEKMKQEMNKDGSLMNLYIQTREQKAVDNVIKGAEIEEVELAKPEEKKD